MTNLEVLERSFQELILPARGQEKWQQLAWQRFLEVGLPTSDVEVYRYVRLRSLYEKQQQIGSCQTEGGISLTEAWQTYRAFLDKATNQWLSSETDPFALINGALCRDGKFLYVPAGKKVELTITHTVEGMAFPRLSVYVGKGAEVTLRVIYQGEASWINGFTEVSLDENAQLSIQTEAENCAPIHFETQRIHVKRDATFKSIELIKSQLSRQDYYVKLLDTGADAKLYGLSRLANQEHAHVNVLMEHIAPHTTSLQKFKGVVADRACSTFEGKIYVHPLAQKTQAYQMNNHLLLGSKAEAKSKPNLEIFADDVKASHGATCGRLDNEALFYLLTRGVKRSLAKELLINAFCQEVMDEKLS